MRRWLAAAARLMLELFDDLSLPLLLLCPLPPVLLRLNARRLLFSRCNGGGAESNEDGSGGGASAEAALNEPSFAGIGGGGRNESLLACPPAEGSGGGASEGTAEGGIGSDAD